MQDWVINIMESFGYVGILLLIAVENIFPPIPSEVILTLGGFMTTKSDMNIFLVYLFATVGSVAGAIVLYALGRFLTEERLGKLIDKFGKVLRLKREDLRRAESWFLRHGNRTVFFCRFIPIIRSLISIPAGMSNMNFWKFLSLTTAGTAIWNVVLVTLGKLAGDQWQKISEYFNTYSKITLVVLIVIGAGVAVWVIRKLKNRSDV
ncbi:MAG: DedA family protein [Oscillospiraceae bacterium]|nr:DedA family protein [Oscillospiraceae bacterium]